MISGRICSFEVRPLEVFIRQHIGRQARFQEEQILPLIMLFYNGVILGAVALDCIVPKQLVSNPSSFQTLDDFL